MKDFIQKYWKYILGLALVPALAFYMYSLGNRAKDAETKLQQATVLSQQQAKDANVLQNMFNESKQNAQMMADFIKHAQTGQLQPVTNFTVMASSPQQAAQQVTDRINKNDPTLPPAVLEKTDQTVVSSVSTTAEQKTAIDKQNAKDGTNISDSYLTQVYKNNNYRNWEWSIGYGVQDGKGYIPVGLQRNYSKDKALEAEVHLDPSKIKKVTGGEIKQVWKTDKLFVIF